MLLCFEMQLNNPIRSYVKCRGCGKRILRSQFKYCRNCTHLRHRLKNEHIPPKGKKSFWACIHKYGHKCRYSGVSLDDHRRKHLKVKKRPVVHWRRLAATMDNRVCAGCGHAAALKGRKYCARCSRIAHRMKKLRLPPQVVNAVWDYLRTYGFICYYTGMPLDLDDPKSPWYLVFDHWMPRDPRKIVVTSALVNEMKGDLTENEFWYFIRQLANFYRNGSTVRKRKLRFWSRPYRCAGKQRCQNI